VTPSAAVFEAAIWVKSIYMIKSWLKTTNKNKCGNQRIFLYKSPFKRWYRNGIHSLLRRADARGSADIIYRMSRISLLSVGHWRSTVQLFPRRHPSATSEYILTPIWWCGRMFSKLCRVASPSSVSCFKFVAQCHSLRPSHWCTAEPTRNETLDPGVAWPIMD